MGQFRPRFLLWSGLLVLSAAGGAMPARVWGGIDTIVVRCGLDSDQAGNASAPLCAALESEIRRGSPYPVKAYLAGAQSLRSPRTLIVDAKIAFVDGGHNAKLRMALQRAVAIDDAEGLMTPPPAILPIGASSAASKGAIDAAVDRVFPWRRARTSSRRFSAIQSKRD